MSQQNHLHFYMDLLRHLSYQEDEYGLFNILNTFNVARNGVICDESFDDLDFGNIPLNGLKFQNRGELTCSFQRTVLDQFSFMAGHAAEIRCAAFSPSGKHLLTASQDHSAILWDTESGLVRQKLDGHTDAVLAIAFSPVGSQSADNGSKDMEPKYCLTGSRDATAILWCLDSGEICFRLEMHTKDVEHVAFSIDGTRCLTGSRDGTLMMWDTQTGKPCYPELLRHEQDINALGYSPDGRHFFSCSRDGLINLWNVADGNLACSIDVHQKSVNQALFSANKGEYLLSASDDGTAVLFSIFDISKRYIRHTFEHPNEAVKAIAYSKNEKFIATGTDKGNVYIWDAITGERILDLKKHRHTISSIHFSEDCAYCMVSSISAEEPVIVYEVNLNILKKGDVKEGRPLHWFHLHDKPVTAIGFTADGKFCFTASEDHTAAIWSPITGTLHHHLKSHIGPIHGVAISPDMKSYITASNGSVILWDAETSTVKQMMKIMTNNYCLLKFSPDSSQFLISSIDQNTIDGVTGNVKVISLTPDTATYSFNIHQNSENLISFSKSGEYLLSADNLHNKSIVTLRRSKTGEKLAQITDLDCKILAIAMSPDERYLLIGGNDGTAALWQIGQDEDGKIIITFHKELLPNHYRAVKAIAFSHDSKQCMVNLGDSAIIVCDVETGRERKRLTGYPQQISTVTFSADDSCYLIGLERGIVVKHTSDTTRYESAEKYDTQHRTCDIWINDDDEDAPVFIDDGKPILFFTASNDGETCYAANLDNQGFLWNIADIGHPIGICPGSGKSSITFSADGQYCLVGCNDGVAKLWNMKDGTLTTELYHISELFISGCHFTHINAPNNVMKILHQYHADIQIAQSAAQQSAFILPSD